MIPQSASADAGTRRTRILVLGGYGHFGARTSRRLAAQPGLTVIVAGRCLTRARALINETPVAPGTVMQARVLDHQSAEFARQLADVAPGILIHAAGPFQHQGYQVANTCIDLGIHYIDLADGRDFVAGILALNDRARAHGVLAVAGASTLPALSDAVVRELARDMAQVKAIQISIAPGQRTPRGLATIAGVLSYCGRGFRRHQHGQPTVVYGWQELHRQHYPSLGTRWLAGVDVPDLDLLPRRYPAVADVACYAALELPPLAWSMWLLSWLARAGVVKDWARYAGPLSRAANWFDRFGSDLGGMHVSVTGTAHGGHVVHRDWHLSAASGSGPEIPATPAVVLAIKLARGHIDCTGARPCVGLLSLAEFAAALAHLEISWKTTSRPTGISAVNEQSPARSGGDTRERKLYPVQRQDIPSQ